MDHDQNTSKNKGTSKKEKTILNDVYCPECGGALFFAEASFYCPVCGFSQETFLEDL